MAALAARKSTAAKINLAAGIDCTRTPKFHFAIHASVIPVHNKSASGAGMIRQSPGGPTFLQFSPSGNPLEAAVATVTLNCDGTVTVEGTVHVAAEGAFAHVIVTDPR